MKVRTFKKKLSGRNDYNEAISLVYKNYLWKKSGCKDTSPNRIIDEHFYVTTKWDVGYINRDNFSFDSSRESITNKKRKAPYLLYAETDDGEFITETDVGYFRDLNSAVNWVGRYGCPNSDKEIYYLLSRRYVYRIWNSTHLTAKAVDSLFGE